MPTDVNVPKWRAECCGTIYEGTDAFKAAEWDEQAPTPEPLPDGTWLVSRFDDLLNKAKWRRVIGHHIVPDWRYNNPNPDAPADLDLQDVTSAYSGHSHRVQRRAIDEHQVYYDEEYVTPRHHDRRTVETARMGSSSDYLTPHLPGVLNFGFGIDSNGRNNGTVGAYGAGLAIGRIIDESFNRRTETGPELETADDREARRDLMDRLVPSADKLALQRYLFGRERYKWDRMSRDPQYNNRLPSQYTFLRPGLDANVVDALMAVCTDTTERTRKGRDNVRRVLWRSPEENPQATYHREREFTPSHEEPHYGVSVSSKSRRTFWHWIEVLALRDHDGDPVAAMRWLVTSTFEEKADRVDREVRAFLDGDTDALIHADVLTPSHGMSRGPRAGRLRPEHKAAAKVLDIDWQTSTATDALSPYLAAADEALTHYGVTVPENLNEPLFGGAPIVAIASGKGGVGKTTTAAAVAEAGVNAGLRVLVIDADVTGPSLGALYDLPVGLPVDENGDLAPTEVKPGLMAVSASQALRTDELAMWGEDATRMWLRFIAVSPNLNGKNAPDLVVLDMPPGYTAQHRAVDVETPANRWLLVTTGSRIAHADLRRAVRATGYGDGRFVGLVENLSVTPSGERLYPVEASQELADDLGVPFLGSLPWNDDPAALAHEPAFTRLADQLPSATRTA